MLGPFVCMCVCLHKDPGSLRGRTTVQICNSYFFCQGFPGSLNSCELVLISGLGKTIYSHTELV